MYYIEIISNTTPDSEGWGDFVSIYENGEKIFTCIGSTCPNIVQPSSGLSWRYAYGWISAGIHPVETINHPKYGKSVLINDGNAVPSRNENVNHNGKKILTELIMHEGGRKSSNKQWRGSAGCPTIPQLHWEEFQDHLPNGKGFLIIKDGE